MTGAKDPAFKAGPEITVRMDGYWRAPLPWYGPDGDAVVVESWSEGGKHVRVALSSVAGAFYIRWDYIAWPQNLGYEPGDIIAFSTQLVEALSKVPAMGLRRML